jgi:TatD DNase family protein
VSGAAPVLRWIDAHCHLPDDPDAVTDLVAEARAAGVERLVTVGTDAESSRRALRWAERFDDVVATVGLHPHDASEGTDEIEALLAEALAGAPGRVVAVGECGLDYHYDHSPRASQRDVFARQIGMAHDHRLPLVIHTREAWDDTFSILDREGVPPATVFHCFTGGPAEASAALARGAHLSISGIVTFPSAPELREAVVLAPLDRLMVETDSPYLAPVPHRGRRNRPALVVTVGEAVAAARSLPPSEVAAATRATTEAFFGLEPVS